MDVDIRYLLKENLILAIIFDVNLTYCFYYTSVCILDVFISQFLRLCLHYLIICGILKIPDTHVPEFHHHWSYLAWLQSQLSWKLLTILQKPIEGCNRISNFYTSCPKSFLFSDQVLLISLYYCLTLKRTMFYMYFSVSK